MRCYVTGKAKTISDSIAIDFIEARRGEKLFVLDWLSYILWEIKRN